MLDTHFQIGEQGKHWSIFGDVILRARLLGQLGGTRESFVCAVVRELTLEVIEITREVAVDPGLDELLLGSHSGSVERMSVGSSGCSCERGLFCSRFL